MSRRTTHDIGVLATGLAIAAVGAIVICLVLASLAKPDHLKARLAHLDQLARRTEVLAEKTGDPRAFPQGAVCDSASVGAGDDLKKRITALAAVAGVTVANLNADTAAGDPSAELTPIKLSFTASGHYDAVLMLLDAISKARPVFFVDTVDLKSQTANVDLKIAGNIYCWTSDHP